MDPVQPPPFSPAPFHLFLLCFTTARTEAATEGRPQERPDRGVAAAPPQAHSPARAFALVRVRRRRAALLRCPSPRAEQRLEFACPRDGGSAPEIRRLWVIFPAPPWPAVKPR